MLILSGARPQTAWKAVTLGTGEFQVELTPPTYEQLIYARSAEDTGAAVLMRLNSITNWRGVLEETADGGRIEIPFSAAALGDLIRQAPAALGALLAVVAPLFNAVSEDERKNSPAPSPAVTADVTALPNTSSAGDSDSLPTPSE